MVASFHISDTCNVPYLLILLHQRTAVDSLGMKHEIDDQQTSVEREGETIIDD